MANFKKGLALVLAAATAFTFAPVSTLGTPVVAEAAQLTSQYAAKNGGVTTTIVAGNGVTYELINQNAEVETTTGSAVVLPTAALGWGIYDAVTGKIAEIPSDAGTVTAGKGSLMLYVKDADKMKTALTGKSIVGFSSTGALDANRKNIEDNAQDVVYVGAINFTSLGNVATKAVEVNASVNATAGVKSDTISKDFLDDVELTAGSNNKIVHNADVTTKGAVVATNQNVTFDDGALSTGATDNILKGMKVNYKSTPLAKGTYYETAYVPYTVGSGTYIAKINLTVNVGTGPKIQVKDGNTVYGSTEKAELSTDPVIYLNLNDNKTFDIRKHIVADVNVDSLEFKYSRDTTNVTVDENGVITANSVGDAVVTVKGSANGQTSEVKLQVRVSQFGADTLTVTDGKDQTADVFTVNDYTNNKANVLADGANNEANLAKAAVKYIQYPVTGNETQNIKVKPVVKSTNNATLRYSFVNDNSAKGVTIDPTTGEITIDYNYVDGKDMTTQVAGVPKGTAALGTYAVRVVASPTAKSELTKAYFMIVIDYPDKAIVDVEDAYKVGTWGDSANQDAIDDWSKDDAADQYYEVLDNKTDALVNSSLYKDEDYKNFDTTLTTDSKKGNKVTVKHAKAGTEGKTLHVIAFNPQNTGEKTGYTAKITTLTAVKGVANYVDTITDVSTGKNIFTNTANGKAHATEFAIEKNAQLKVALKNPVAATSSIELRVGEAKDNHIVNQDQFVTAVVDNDNTTVDLYRNAEGTQVIGLVPAGHISKTDRSIVRNETTNLAVTYRADKAEEEIAKPAKVSGLKVTNVKGAKAKVSFKKVKGALGYKVVYKVGKKTVTKTLKGAAKTSVTLKVAKGKKVTVKVRAYNKSVKGKTQFGAYSAKKTLKTDKK